MVSRLHEILKPFVLRRVKADVDIGVPPKQEVVLYAEMAEEQRRLTRALIDGTLQASGGGKVKTVDANRAWDGVDVRCVFAALEAVRKDDWFTQVSLSCDCLVVSMQLKHRRLSKGSQCLACTLEV